MKKLKMLTIVLAIVAIIMVGFFGVYTQVQNRMENQVKEYSFARNLNGSRNVKLKLDTGNNTVIKDAEGKEVEDATNLSDDELKEKGYVKEETPYNSEEVKTSENYKKSKQIIEQRLKEMGITDYNIQFNEQTGDMAIICEENDSTDSMVSNIYTTGKFEIIDSQTKELLMNNSDIEESRVIYSNSSGMDASSAGTVVGLEISFTKDGAKKLEDISNKYVATEDENNSNENQTSENTTTDENTEATEEEKEDKKQITMKIDDQDIMTTDFEEPIRTGKIQLSIGSATTDKDKLQDYIVQATNMATVLDNGNLPVKYTVDENQYVLSNITENEIQIAEYVILAVIAFGLLVLIFRFKLNGVLGAISYAGFAALYSLILRYANVVLSLEGVLGAILILAINYGMVTALLSYPKNRTNAYKKFLIKMIPVAILAVTFCFVNWVPLSSFGMTMFWGLILLVAYNAIITNPLLKIKEGKEKEDGENE